jgi:uncharacterized UPF0160 family protein
MSALNLQTLNVVTHNGIFHPDEVTGLGILKLANGDKEVKITRSRNPKDWEEADCVLDVGGVYDYCTNRFDHHQGDFDRTYEDSVVKMATAGLVWEKFYREASREVIGENLSYLEYTRVHEYVEENLIKMVDAHDNNQALHEVGVRGSDETLVNHSYSNIISGFNGSDGGFEQAIEVAMMVLRNTINSAWKKIKGEKIFKQALADRMVIGEGRAQTILVLPEFVPWQDLLRNVNQEETIGFCVYPDLTGQWRVQTVKDENGEDILSLPKEWGALRAEELQKVTEVEDAVFCHKNLFIAGSESMDGAIDLAKLAMENA